MLPHIFTPLFSAAVSPYRTISQRSHLFHFFIKMYCRDILINFPRSCFFSMLGTRHTRLSLPLPYQNVLPRYVLNFPHNCFSSTHRTYTRLSLPSLYKNVTSLNLLNIPHNYLSSIHVSTFTTSSS